MLCIELLLKGPKQWEPRWINNIHSATLLYWVLSFLNWIHSQACEFLVLDKTIKLWKISERDKRAEGYNLKDEDGRLRDPFRITALRVCVCSLPLNTSIFACPPIFLLPKLLTKMWFLKMMLWSGSILCKMETIHYINNCWRRFLCKAWGQLLWLLSCVLLYGGINFPVLCWLLFFFLEYLNIFEI